MPATWQWVDSYDADLANPQTLELFRDYHLARGTLRVDWDAAFKTWVRRQETWDDA
jgi:hypothetical protein